MRLPPPRKAGGRGSREGAADKITVGLLIVCEGPFSSRYQSHVAFINTSTDGGNAVLELDGQRVHFQRKLPKSLCTLVYDRLSPDTEHELAVIPKGKELIGLSHVIWA